MTERYGRYLHYFCDRRNGKERRKFSYTIHSPERRSGIERRSGSERRTGKEKRLGSERRKSYRQKITAMETDDKSTVTNIVQRIYKAILL